MADFQPSASGQGRKLRTPRIDLTPMVDLGFLLITFFMYTTTMAKPKVMELRMPMPPPPDEIIDGPAIPAEATITILPAANHKVAWYRGEWEVGKPMNWCSFRGANSLRQLLQDESARVRALPSSYSREAHKLHVLIKADTAAAFDDIVRSLDEMAIAEVPYYTMMRITDEEQSVIKKFQSTSYGK